jgi:hypothetical protein
MTDVVLALCFDCNSFLINPPDDQGHCASCLKTVGPSATLSRYTVPHGSRVDPSGAVFAPDGRELLRSRRPEKPDGLVARVRRLMDGLDLGLCTEAGVEGELLQRHIQYLVGHLQAGETLHVLGPWCGPEVPPAVTVRAEIEYDPVHITIRPL